MTGNLGKSHIWTYLFYVKFFEHISNNIILSEGEKYISQDEALQKLQHYCAYQDRCHREVRTKLIKMGVYGDELEEIIIELIRENFLNEERFAKSFARGKFRLKRWGKNRILRELKMRDISDYCIRKAMEEINDEDYHQTLQAVLIKKVKTLKDSNTFKRNQKLAQYAIRRGFEAALVWEEIKLL